MTSPKSPAQTAPTKRAPRKTPAASSSTDPKPRTRKLTSKQLDALIDEGIELSVQAAINILRDPAEKSYVKMKVLPLFNQHLARRIAERGGDGNDLQARFMSLMAEIRDVPGVATLVTEKGIVEVPEGELLVEVDEEVDFDADAG